MRPGPLPGAPRSSISDSGGANAKTETQSTAWCAVGTDAPAGTDDFARAMLVAASEPGGTEKGYAEQPQAAPAQTNSIAASMSGCRLLWTGQVWAAFSSIARWG